ncbi:MAG: hypothetical protein ACRDSH_01020 [Pseudonocardiaceae bacterium]
MNIPVLSGLPRAASISARTMELLRSWGLEQQIRDGGVDVEWRHWVTPRWPLPARRC